MKIMMINTLFYPNIVGGAERSVQHLAEKLVDMGHKVSVVSLADKAYHKEINGVNSYYLKLSNLYSITAKRKIAPLRFLWNLIDIYNPLMAKKISKILESEKPDIVQTNNIQGFSPLIWETIAKYNIPIVHTIRDYYLICPRSSMTRNNTNCSGQCFSCKLFSAPKRRFSDKVKSVIGISKFVLNRHLEYGWFANAEQSVIFNSYKPPDKIPARTHSERVRFGYIGRIDPRKGVENLIRTFLSFGDHAEIELVMAGSGEDEYISRMKRITEGAKVSFPGFCKREDFFSKIDVLVVPSLWHEPLGRIILEAYSFGIPVIGSKRGGIPEIIDEDKSGFLFDPDSESDLKRVMKKFIDDKTLAKQLLDYCIQKSHEFSEELIAEKYLEVYRHCLHKVEKKVVS